MILVTGSSGFVGGEILKSCKDAIACPSLRGLGEDDIRRILEKDNISAIIHTAAISDIGECERNPEDSYIANVQIPIYLARAAGKRKLICFSSDQVYGGSDLGGAYSEDMAKPANVYAAHKLEMEERVLDINPNAVMLRAEWMYGYYHKKTNYLMNILNATESVSFSSRQFRGITYVREIAENMEKVASLPGGSYNFGSETTRSMYEITREFIKIIGKEIKVNDAPARHNLWMKCDKAKRHGISFSSVEDGLRKCAMDHNLLINPEYATL